MSAQCEGLTSSGGVRHVVLAVGACVALLGASADLAEAKSIKGTKQADRLVGTKKGDRISGRAGNDRINGKKGADKLKGGAGKDRINAVDGAKDKKIRGGPGKDVCRVDAAERSAVRGCEKVKTVGSSGNGGTAGGNGGNGGNGSAGGGTGGGSGGGDGSGGGTGDDGTGGGDGTGPLTIVSSDGVSCATGNPIPPCVFQIAGTGADALVGTVSGGGGVTVTAGAAVSADGSTVAEDDWTAAGSYTCTSNGFIHVEIGSESVDVPVTCTTA